MGDPVQLIPAGSQLWAEYLHPTCHDFYYSEAYHDFMQEQGYGEAWLAVVGSREKSLIWPFLLRSVNPASAPPQKVMRDVTSVYGYTGPLASGCAPGDPFLSDAWNALLTHWRASGVVSLFCRFHPLLQNHRWVADSVGETVSAVPPLQLTLEGHTVSLDLTRTDEEAWAEYRVTHRRHMNRARQCGLICEVDYEFAHLPDFVRLYHSTMQRNRAAAKYFYSADSFDLLRRKLAPAISLHVVRAGDRLAAAALVSEYQGIVQYLFAGVEDQFVDVSPLKLLLEAIRKWSHSRGNRVLHLGGGRGGREDSLFYFKSGFSRRRHPFYTGRCTLDPELYASLSEEHRSEARMLGKTLDPDFFPAYRAPFSEVSADQTEVSPVSA